MVYRQFDFDYTHRLKKYKASCTVMDALHFPGHIMYRVVVKAAKNEHVHIFYKIDQPGKMFYSFPLPDMGNLISKSITERLERLEDAIQR